MLRKLILAVCIASLCAVAVSAQVTRYTLTNINFSTPPVYANGAYVPGSSSADSSAVGTFDYNSISKTISNISIVTTNTPGTLYCYGVDTAYCPTPSPPSSTPPGLVLNYTGSTYISSVPNISSGGATAEVIADSANGNNQQIMFMTNASLGGGTVTPPGLVDTKKKCEQGGSCACTNFLIYGCILTLTIPKNSLGGGNIQLVSDFPGGAQSAPGSADPQVNPICATESWPAADNGSFVRYSFAPCGSLTAVVIQSGGGFTAFAIFIILVAAYAAARVLRRSRARSV